MQAPLVFRFVTVRSVVLGSLAALLLAGCSAPEYTDEEWVSLAQQRSVERWQALIAGRVETAYEFLSPAYREAVPYEKYARKIRGLGLWKNAEARNATCDETRCIVTTELTVEVRNPRMAGPAKANATVEERWIKDRENRQLWFVPNK